MTRLLDTSTLGEIRVYSDAMLDLIEPVVPVALAEYRA